MPASDEISGISTKSYAINFEKRKSFLIFSRLNFMTKNANFIKKIKKLKNGKNSKNSKNVKFRKTGNFLSTVPGAYTLRAYTLRFPL